MALTQNRWLYYWHKWASPVIKCPFDQRRRLVDVNTERSKVSNWFNNHRETNPVNNFDIQPSIMSGEADYSMASTDSAIGSMQHGRSFSDEGEETVEMSVRLILPQFKFSHFISNNIESVKGDAFNTLVHQPSAIGSNLLQ